MNHDRRGTVYQAVPAHDRRAGALSEVAAGPAPGEILDHAAEYTVREDIVMEMEELELPEAQARALLKSRTPLANIYKEWKPTTWRTCGM